MEKEVTLKSPENKLTVTVSNSKEIQILDAGKQVVGGVRSNRISAPEVFRLEPGKYTVVTDGNIQKMKTESEDLEMVIDISRLQISSDAKDFHVVDGIGEIPADGTSFCTIAVRKLSGEGKPLARKKDNETLFLRTSAGTIKDNEGKEEIRSVQLAKGEASFRLYSEDRKRLATVEVISEYPLLEDSSIKIEFF